MGTYKKSVLGPFFGKIGTIIGSTWNGIVDKRSSTKASTDLQLMQRAKIGFPNGFLGTIGSPFCPLNFCPFFIDYFPLKTIIPIKSKSQSSAQIPIKKLTLRFLLKAPKKNVQ
jgi:hypothetical protein